MNQCLVSHRVQVNANTCSVSNVLVPTCVRKRCLSLGHEAFLALFKRGDESVAEDFSLFCAFWQISNRDGSF